ncbi:hypothetical protein ACQEVC_32670 [Plantactinospora sp. CA-294935]|uniref:hypothetical protein n=1 Tax=Plantactinospora sp. CA-294935 TaxID=3240012 RepID=UPI003D8C4C27
MKRPHRISPQHRRDWRRLWRYCRCGYRWRCPDSVDLVPMPYAPTVPPLGRAAAYPEAVRVSAVPPARVRAGNQRPVGRTSGRNARLAAPPAARSRHAGRVPS